MKSILFVLFFVLSVAAFFACYAEAGDRVVVRQPFFRPNKTVIRQAPQRQQIVVQPRQNFVVQHQPQAFILQQPQQFFFQQPQAFRFAPQAFSFGGHVQQFSAPCNGNCPSALLFGR